VSPTRRAVLAGAVGAVALAGCDTRRVEVRRGTLRSRHWPGHEVAWRIAAQAFGEADERPLVVVLHGRGGNAASAFDALHLDDHVLTSRLTVASVDGGDAYWHARRGGVDPGAMVVEDFLPLVRRETGARGKVALLGWSMGGYGALLLAARLGPDRVGAVVAESAALWTDARLSAAGAFDDRADFEANDVFAPRRLRTLAQLPVRLDCGRDDPFAAANRVFAAALPSAHLTVDDGGHTTTYWRAHAGAQLDWVAAQLRGDATGTSRQ
jgi:pimeloyl-ACP methyl ester carboxylesterase